MKRYTQKPIPIIAIQFTGDNMDELSRFLNNSRYGNRNKHEIQKDHIIKDRFILSRDYYHRDYQHSRDFNCPLYFKKGDYFFTEDNEGRIKDLMYVVDFLEQAEFERKYERND